MFIFVQILVFFLVGAGYQSAPAGSIRILPESFMTIDGTSNINRFSLRFDFGEYADELDLSISSEENHMVIHPYTLHIPIREFKCKNILLLRNFREALKYREQPDILIYIDSLMLSEVKTKKMGNIHTEVQIGGVRMPEEISYLLVENEDGILSMIGTVRINMNDFQLECGTKFLGLIQVDEWVNISFFFNFDVYNDS